MSVWSRQRQSIYFLAALAIIIVIAVGWWYSYNPIPACNDSRQNGDETGIDCGGSCELVCRGQTAPLKILWSRVFPVSSGLYSAVALIENPNINAGVKNLAYTFRLVDDRNILVTTKTGNTFANPGEKFLIIAGGVSTGYGRPSRAFLELSPVTWQRSDQAEPKLIVAKKIFTNGAPARLVATINNQSIFDLPRVEVSALLVDGVGNAIGAGSTFIANLARAGNREAFFAWPEAFTSAPAVIDVYSRVNVFELSR